MDLDTIIKEYDPHCDVSSLLQKPSYQSYLRPPHYIISYLHDLGIPYDSSAVLERLGIFYLWLKSVDDAVDSGAVIVADNVARRLQTIDIPSTVAVTMGRESPGTFESCKSSGSSEFSDEGAMEENYNLTYQLTEVLKQVIVESKCIVVDTLMELYGVVQEESRATSVREYLCVRKKSGRLTALATYQIIEPYITDPQGEFRRFLVDLGELGNLMDSAIDFEEDNHSFEGGKGVIYAAALWKAVTVFFCSPIQILPTHCRGTKGFVRRWREGRLAGATLEKAVH